MAVNSHHARYYELGSPTHGYPSIPLGLSFSVLAFPFSKMSHLHVRCWFCFCVFHVRTPGKGAPPQDVLASLRTNRPVVSSGGCLHIDMIGTRYKFDIARVWG